MLTDDVLDTTPVTSTPSILRPTESTPEKVTVTSVKAAIVAPYSMLQVAVTSAFDVIANNNAMRKRVSFFMIEKF